MISSSSPNTSQDTQCSSTALRDSDEASAAADAIWDAAAHKARLAPFADAPAPKERVLAWVGVNNPYAGVNLDELVASAASLSRGDASAVEEMLRAGLSLEEPEIHFERLIAAIAESNAGLGLRVLRSTVRLLRAGLDRAMAPTANELRQRDEQTAVTAANAKGQRIADLENSSRSLASDANLLGRLIGYAHDQGVVGEEAAIVATFLTAVSRTLEEKAGCMVRTGAAAAGKNFVIETILATLEPNDRRDPAACSQLIRLSSSSPLALIYSGGADNEDSLRGHLVYVPEASSLLDTSGQERPGVGILRTLISEGQVDHHVALPTKDEDGNRLIETRKIVRRGPVAVILTTARGNIEQEMLTRLMLVPADESSDQTLKVHRSKIARSSGFAPPAVSGTTLADWRNYQAWIGAGGPYRVAIPFFSALEVAYHAMKLPLRARRDIDGVLTAIKASAVAHRLQRDVEKGRIVATVDDYRWAHIAFASGLAELYRPQVGQNVLALVRVIEQAIAEKRRKAADKQTIHAEQITSVNEVELSHDQIASKLGLSSRDVVTDRIRKAITAGLIEVTNPSAARSVRRSYRVLVSSQDVKANSGNYTAMPTPERVEELLSVCDAAPRDYPF